MVWTAVRRIVRQFRNRLRLGLVVALLIVVSLALPVAGLVRLKMKLNSR